MHTFRIVPIPDKVAEQVRGTLKAPKYGHPAHVEVATGYGPCRSCLRTFDEGQEKRILFTYDPFHALDSYPSPGPIFIHEQPCRPFSEEDQFCEDLRRIPLVLEGFNEDRWLISEDRFRDGKLEQRAEKIFSDPRIKYVHLRNGEAGCFIARLERKER